MTARAGRLLAAALAWWLPVCAQPGGARAAGDDQIEPYARVVVESAQLRSGPGAGFRAVRRAARGDVFPLRERASRGYWFRVQLPDGTSAWIPGDAVYVFELGPARARAAGSRVFAPAPLPQATGEVPVLLGAMRQGGGLMAVRPTWLLDPTFGVELSGAALVSDGGRVFMATLGGVVNLFPDWPVVPFVVVGGGFSQSTPNADSFVLEQGTTSLMSGGGGLRLGFKYRLVLRIESRAHVFFQADRTLVQQELSGGLSVFF